MQRTAYYSFDQTPLKFGQHHPLLSEKLLGELNTSLLRNSRYNLLNLALALAKDQLFIFQFGLFTPEWSKLNYFPVLIPAI